jgi:RNA polymerase sigma-B factor
VPAQVAHRRSRSYPEWPVPVDVVQALLRQREALAPADPRYSEIGNRVVELCLPVADRIARRFRVRGHSREDLYQVAAVGLMQALNRYDPSRGFEFLAFAVPTMLGELRHYVRDKSGAVRVPRGLQEMRLRVRHAREELTHRLYRTPTVTDLAAYLGATETDVIESDLAAAAHRWFSLNLRVARDRPRDLDELLGEHENGFDRIDYHLSLRRLIRDLSDRDRELLALRFLDDLTQAEISGRLGMSQVHVSRLLSRVLSTLRRRLTEDD